MRNAAFRIRESSLGNKKGLWMISREIRKGESRPEFWSLQNNVPAKCTAHLSCWIVWKWSSGIRTFERSLSSDCTLKVLNLCQTHIWEKKKKKCLHSFSCHQLLLKKIRDLVILKFLPACHPPFPHLLCFYSSLPFSAPTKDSSASWKTRASVNRFADKRGGYTWVSISSFSHSCHLLLLHW